MEEVRLKYTILASAAVDVAELLITNREVRTRLLWSPLVIDVML